MLVPVVGSEHLTEGRTRDGFKVVDCCTHDDFDELCGRWNGCAFLSPESIVCEGCASYISDWSSSACCLFARLISRTFEAVESIVVDCKA